jgi:hypothetical protein
MGMSQAWTSSGDGMPLTMKPRERNESSPCR